MYFTQMPCIYVILNITSTKIPIQKKLYAWVKTAFSYSMFYSFVAKQQTIPE